MTDQRHISPEDLALHAMQALPAEECAGVRAHLAECAQCRDELAALTGDLALVALGVDQQAVPAGARERFLAKLPINAEPEKEAAGQIEESGLAKTVSITTKRKGSAAVWVPWLAAAALLVLAISLGQQVQSLKLALQRERDASAQQAAASARAQQVVDVLSAPTAQHVLLTAAKTPPQPTGRAVYLPARGGLIFQGNNLAKLSDDKTYELWVIPANGSAPIPAGLFRPDTAGNASVVLPTLPVGVPAKAFGVTIENAAGSATPTAPIILAGAAPTSGE
jgi:hypothetical protein